MTALPDAETLETRSRSSKCRGRAPLGHGLRSLREPHNFRPRDGDGVTSVLVRRALVLGLTFQSLCEGAMRPRDGDSVTSVPVAEGTSCVPEACASL